VQADEVTGRGECAEFPQFHMETCLFGHVYLDRLMEIGSTIECVRNLTQPPVYPMQTSLAPDVLARVLCLPPQKRQDLLEAISAASLSCSATRRLVERIDPDQVQPSRVRPS
jgi:hypothetical protein